MELKCNTQLLIAFLNCRRINGIPTKLEILLSIQKTKTKTVIPEGWMWK